MLGSIFRWLFGAQPQPDAPQKDEPELRRAGVFSTDWDIDDSLTRDQRMDRLRAAAVPTPKARVIDDTGMVMDSNSYGDGLKAAFSLNTQGVPDAQAEWYGGQTFIGHQMCAVLAQQWLINRACSLPARDAIRKGYDVTANDGRSDVTPAMLSALMEASKRFKVDHNLVEFVRFGRVFGIRIAWCMIESDDPEFYVKPFNPDGITAGSYRGITQVDPYWCVPELSKRAASDPSAPDFYEPTYWVINGKRYHKSHLIVMRGQQVADILKPAYLYGGLSVPQLIYERVYAAERTANEAPQLAMTKRAMVFYTDAAKALANQAQFENRLAVWARFRDNFGVKVADKEADQIDQKDTSLADLDSVIMTQYQIVAAASEVPVTKLMGTQLKGFSTGEGEAESYHETLETIQSVDAEPLLNRHLVCVIRSEIAPRFSIRPFDVTVSWRPVKSLSAEQVANLNKTKADTDKALSDIGGIDGLDVRRRLAADELSGYNGLEVPSNAAEIPADE